MASPISANYGSVAVGSQQTQSVVLINEGPGPVKVTAVSISGAGFAVGSVGLPIVLAKGANLSLSASFSPTGPQPASGTLEVISNAGNSPLTVSLAGQGAALSKLLSAMPSQVNFGSVFLGKSSNASVTLANSGNVPVTISNVAGASGSFSVAGTSPGTTIAPGQSTNLSVTFAPNVAGTASGNIAVQSDAASAVTIGLSGIGIQASGHAVALTWQSEDATAGYDVAGYNVYRQDADGAAFVKINDVLITAPNYEDLQILPGSTYSYVITAVTGDGIESPQSDPVSATIPTT